MYAASALGVVTCVGACSGACSGMLTREVWQDVVAFLLHHDAYRLEKALALCRQVSACALSCVCAQEF